MDVTSARKQTAERIEKHTGGLLYQSSTLLLEPFPHPKHAGHFISMGEASPSTCLHTCTASTGALAFHDGILEET